MSNLNEQQVVEVMNGVAEMVVEKDKNLQNYIRQKLIDRSSKLGIKQQLLHNLSSSNTCKNQFQEIILQHEICHKFFGIGFDELLEADKDNFIGWVEMWENKVGKAVK